MNSSTDAGNAHSLQIRFPKNQVVSSNISANHGHSLILSEEMIQSGLTQEVDIKGQSGHPHRIVITEDHFRQLRLGQKISVSSSQDAGHTHEVQIFR